MGTRRTHDQGYTRVFGFTSAVCLFALASESLHENPFLPYLCFAALFIGGALIDSHYPLHAAICLGFALHHGFFEAVSILSLIAVVCAAIIVFRRGWFVRNNLYKGLIVGALGCAAILGPLFVSELKLSSIVASVIYAGIFAVIVQGLARGRFLSAFAPKKRILLLSDYGLTKREQSVAKMRASGISVKEIATTQDISISCVRNSLSTSYRKLSILGSGELVALGERYLIK
jgi:DNA-binding CsgD family transcriptional regulator